MNDESIRRELIAEIGREMVGLQNAFSARDEALAAHLGVNRTDLECMGYLLRLGPLTAGQLATESALTPGAITAALDRLERAGHARRVRDDADRRRVLVELSPTGRAKIEPLFTAITAAGTAQAEKLTLEQLQLMRDFLARARELQFQHATHLRATEQGATAQNGEGDSSAPLGTATSGHLKFTHGGASIMLRADRALDGLYKAHFEGSPPNVEVSGGVVTIDYRRRFRPFDWNKHRADIVLNGSLPWRVDLRAGASKLIADLRELELTSFELAGGAAEIDVSLPRPHGTVPVRLTGGASKVGLHRPTGVPASAQLTGGASKLVFDNSRLGSFGGLTRLQSDGFDAASDRYEIRFAGGASQVTIDTV
jgi:DNA-binding MarR family transcriptional regulator